MVVLGSQGRHAVAASLWLARNGLTCGGPDLNERNSKTSLAAGASRLNREVL
jgi:hypothetical protein